jgi:hypothetical protein
MERYENAGEVALKTRLAGVVAALFLAACGNPDPGAGGATRDREIEVANAGSRTGRA